LILIATGSEVSLALEAREKLQAEGIADARCFAALLGAVRRTN
jgi:transketolase